MADQLAFLPERVLTAAAMPGTGYKVSFFQSGTTTPVTVYSAADLLTPLTQPIVCDASGVFPQVFSSGGAVKAVVTKPDDSVFYTLDPVFRVPTSASGASDITFTPTGPLPFTNVQDAIEGAAAAAVTGFAAFGLGITGNATLLADIDATNIGAGTYRFDGTTIGTYPTGVTSANTGLVEHWRQSASAAMQVLYHATTDRVFHRRMASSVWGAWREVITVNQGATLGDTMYRGASVWTRLAAGSAYRSLAMGPSSIPVWGGDLFFRLDAANVGANGTSAQNVLPVNVTLDAGTQYEYELVYSLLKTAGATSHNVRSFFGGTATLNNAYRSIMSSSAVGSTFNSLLGALGHTTNFAENVNVSGTLAAASTAVHVIENGTFSVDAAGTVIPQYILSAAPGGAYSVVAGAYFRLRPLGAENANITQGTWA